MCLFCVCCFAKLNPFAPEDAINLAWPVAEEERKIAMDNHPFSRDACMDGRAPLLPCDELMRSALVSNQSAVVKALVQKWPVWFKTNVWWVPFEKTCADEYHGVPRIALAARHCDVELFKWIVDEVGDNLKVGFAGSRVTLVSPLREATLAGRLDIVEFLLGQERFETSGCNCEDGMCW